MLNESGESSMQEQSIIKSTDPDKKYRRVLAASTLAGDQVQNTAGEKIGNVNHNLIHFPKFLSGGILHLIAGQRSRCQYATILLVGICAFDYALLLHRTLPALVKHLPRRSVSANIFS